MLQVVGRYRYSIGFLCSLIIAIILFTTGAFANLVLSLGRYGYVSSFIAGMFFSFTFTAPSASLYLVNLGEHLNPWFLAIIGGIGAMLGDMLLYRFIRDGLINELKSLCTFIIPVRRMQKMEKFTKKKVFLWTMPFLASILIASPLPDELGVTLFGLINFKPKYLSLITFLLNSIGILTLIFIGYTIAN